MDVILEYVSIWLPSLAGILGVVAAVLTSLKRTSEAIEEFKADDTLKSLKEDLLKIREANIQLANQNRELIRQNDLLIDEIKKIKNYRNNRGSKESWNVR